MRRQHTAVLLACLSSMGEAGALGVTVPATVLVRADEVIE
jgi:hypothetical protein